MGASLSKQNTIFIFAAATCLAQSSHAYFNIVDNHMLRASQSYGRDMLPDSDKSVVKNYVGQQKFPKRLNRPKVWSTYPGLRKLRGGYHRKRCYVHCVGRRCRKVCTDGDSGPNSGPESEANGKSQPSASDGDSDNGRRRGRGRDTLPELEESSVAQYVGPTNYPKRFKKPTRKELLTVPATRRLRRHRRQCRRKCGYPRPYRCRTVCTDGDSGPNSGPESEANGKSQPSASDGGGRGRDTLPESEGPPVFQYAGPANYPKRFYLSF